MSYLASIISIILPVAGTLTVIAGGVLYILGTWKKTKDEDSKKLVDILKDTVDALETKVDDQKQMHDELIGALTKKMDMQSADIKNLTKKVDQLESENGTLTKVLQGRDDQTQIFYKKAFEAMEVAAKTLVLVEQMNKNHTDLMRMLVEHLKPGVTINNQQPPQPNPPGHIVT